MINHGADTNVLNSEQRGRYQYLVPLVISIQGYYQIESDIERIQDPVSLGDRYILSTEIGTYVLMK